LSEHSSSVDLTTGSLWDNIWHMTWPMLLVMFFNFLVGIADIYVAGFIGPYFFIIIVANAISIGTVAIVSRAVGSGKFKDALSAAKQSLLFGIACAIMLTITGLLLKNHIIAIAGFSGNTRQVALDFFVIFVFALAPNYIVIISNAIFRAGGEVKLTLMAMFIVSMINIALNFLFVFGLFSFEGFGYKGIAFATATAMSVGMLICFFLFRQSRWKNIFSGAWVITYDLVKRIFTLSWPAALIYISWNSGNILIYNILSRLQEGSIAAMASLTNGLRIEAIIYLPVFALNMAASVLTGQNLGAGEPKRAEKIGWKISLSGVALVSFLALPIFILAESIAAPIAKNQMVLTETVRYLRITMISEPFMAISVVLGGCLMGAGDTKGAMLVILSTLWIIRLPLAYLLSIVLGYGAVGVWIAMITSMFFQGIAMTFRFKRGYWKTLQP